MMVYSSRLRDHVISSVTSCSTQLHAPLTPNTPFGLYDYLANNSPGERTKLMELLSQVENCEYAKIGNEELGFDSGR